MFDLRAHSIRRYFKTQMLTLGVQPEYVDYMIGHTVDTCHDIQSLGVDKLRNVYAAASFLIKPKTQVSKIEGLKEIIRAWGMTPEQLPCKDELTEDATTYKNQEELEIHQLTVLGEQIRHLIQQAASNFEKS